MVEGAGEVVGVRREAKGGERVWREWPILFIAPCLGYWSFPVESNASGMLEGLVDGKEGWRQREGNTWGEYAWATSGGG